MALFRSGEGLLANLFALMAFGFSIYTYYQTSWRQPQLRVFVPPVIAYADPYNGPFDVYEIPLTIANSGARAGVITSAALEARDPSTGETKRYYAAKLGRWKEAWETQGDGFAPIAVEGKASETATILFYPRPEETVDRLVKTDPGAYDYRLTLTTVAIDRTPLDLDLPETLEVSVEFQRRSEGVDYRAFNEGGTTSLFAADFATAASD